MQQVSFNYRHFIKLTNRNKQLLPFVATSFTGTLRVFAMEPMNENITTPPKALVRESPTVTTAASLKGDAEC